MKLSAYDNNMYQTGKRKSVCDVNRTIKFWDKCDENRNTAKPKENETMSAQVPLSKTQVIKEYPIDDTPSLSK